MLFMRRISALSLTIYLHPRTMSYVSMSFNNFPEIIAEQKLVPYFICSVKSCLYIMLSFNFTVDPETDSPSDPCWLRCRLIYEHRRSNVELSCPTSTCVNWATPSIKCVVDPASAMYLKAFRKTEMREFSSDKIKLPVIWFQVREVMKWINSASLLQTTVYKNRNFVFS